MQLLLHTLRATHVYKRWTDINYRSVVYRLHTRNVE